MKRIIVPTDFSEQATYALDFACDIARKDEDKDVEVTLVHVVEIPKKSASFLGGSAIDTEATLSEEESMERLFILKLIERRKNQFQELLADPKYSDVNINDRLLRGTPYEEIGQTITEVQADMIIMGTTGADTWEEGLIGSTAEKVVRFATCPVFTTREPVNINKIKKVVLASDFKDDLGEYKDLPAKVQKIFGATLHLVYVNTLNHFLNDREIHSRMDEYIAQNKLSGVHKHVYNHKDAVDGILWFAEDYKMDLILMTTAGERSGLFKLFDHSKAEEVVNHAKIPVVTANLHLHNK